MGDILNTVLTGDCLVESEQIASGSVDLILTDLPYGTVTNIANSERISHGMKNKTAWDNALDPTPIFDIANRILRKNGKMVLFSQEPYTTQLINEAIPNVPFAYRMIWEKDHFANSLIAKKAPVSYYEDVLVFSKSSEATPPHDFDGVHPLRSYFAEIIAFVGLSKKAIIDTIGQRADHCLRTNSTQFSLCTEPTYNALIQKYGIDKMPVFKEFRNLKAVDADFKKSNEVKRLGYLMKHNETYPSVFNLWEGGKYKSNILRYKKDYNGYHPTQKPVALLEDLIKTFSNEDDLVVDLTAGSGSTAVAAVNSGRNFVAIEKDAGYVEIAEKRIEESLSELQHS